MLLSKYAIRGGKKSIFISLKKSLNKITLTGDVMFCFDNFNIR